jgi:hypothetical protein
MPRFLSRTACLAVTAVTMGCAAHIGAPNPALLEQMAAAGAFGAGQTVRICALLEPGIAESTARRLLDEAWNDTEARALGLRMELVSATSWKSEGRDLEAIMSGVRKRPVPPECDRLLAFLGESDERAPRLAGGVSLAHGFVVASADFVRRPLLAPTAAARHELYHLAGCGHAQVMDECYRRIALAKQRRKGPDAFFPVFLYLEDADIERNCGENRLIEDRGEANRAARLRGEALARQAAGETQPARCHPSRRVPGA